MISDQNMSGYITIETDMNFNELFGYVKISVGYFLLNQVITL